MKFATKIVFVRLPQKSKRARSFNSSFEIFSERNTFSSSRLLGTDVGIPVGIRVQSLWQDSELADANAGLYAK